MALKNLFGDLALDQSLRVLLRLLARTSYDTGGNLKVTNSPIGTQPVNGTVTANQSAPWQHQQSQQNFNLGFRSKISKS